MTSVFSECNTSFQWNGSFINEQAHSKRPFSLKFDIFVSRQKLRITVLVIRDKMY